MGPVHVCVADDDDSPSQGVRVIQLSGAIDGDTTRIN